MTGATRQAEADRVEAVYYWAVQQLGAAAAIDAQKLYEREQPLNPNPSSTGWLRQVIRMVFGFRKPGQELALAYYRLTRALRTGHTYPGQGEEAGGSVSLEQLRHEFEDIVDHIDVETGAGDGTPPPRNLSVVDDEEIPLEEGPDLEAMIAALDERAMNDALENLDKLGTSALLSDIESGRDEQEAYENARDRQAAAAMRITLNAARGLSYDLADTDLRIEGWVRRSTTGTPCGWCAMLMSRGFTAKSGLYSTRGLASGKSSGSTTVKAGKADVGDKFHDNCHCVAVPIFLMVQLDNPMFDLNREYAELWPKVTAGKGGKEALRLWRAYIRAQQSNAETETPAQVAA